MPKPLQGADNWAPTSRSEPSPSRPADTIERVIERRIPASTPPAPPKRARAPVAPVAPPLPSASVLMSAPLAYLFAANHALSGSALKVLMAVLEAGNGAALLRNDFKRLTGLSGNHAVLNAIQECVDKEWLTRQYQCRWCQAILPSTYDSIRLIACTDCGRTMTPQAVFCLAVPDEGVLIEHTGGVPNEHTAVPFEHTGVSQQHTRVSLQQTGMPNEHTEGVSLQHTLPQSQTEKDRVLNQHTRTSPEPIIARSDERQGPSASLNGKLRGVLIRHTGVPYQHTEGVPNEHAGVPNKHTSHMRADSDSGIINRDSDSRFPPSAGSGETGRIVYASEEWQQMTEKLAKDCAKRIGDKSVGFQVKCWSHARKLDWDKGGRRFEEGLLQIAHELAGKHNATGKPQGALWTKMVRRYFEEKGHPLLTEAEVEEWKGIHGSYQPPQL